MTNNMTPRPKVRGAIVGVDTHKHIHVAVAVDACGAPSGRSRVRRRFRRLSGPSRVGRDTRAHPGVRHRRHRRLWRGLDPCGPPRGASCRGSESSGPTPAPYCRQVRPDRRRGRRPVGAGGPCDRDAEDRGWAVEMIRQLKVARDTAVKARTAAMNTLKQISVNAPSVVREPLHGLTAQRMLARCAGLRPGRLDTTSTSRDSRPRRRPPSGRGSAWAPTSRPSS